MTHLKPRVLIVDDEPAIRNLLSLAFTRAGYDVCVADGATRAMQAFRSAQFDAVLSDVNMPGQDGHQLMRWLAAHQPGIRSVLMSGHDITCGQCPYEGRCTLIRKPFNPKDVVGIIRRVLDAPAPQTHSALTVV